MAVLAAVAAAVIGLNLPGARSVALVAWHGRGGAVGETATTGIPGGTLPQGIQISTLVQVAQQEVDDPSVVLFTVHSSTPTREMVAGLDYFNGSSWTATTSGPSTPVRSFSPPLSADESQPPPATPDGPGHEQLVQVFDVARLAGLRHPSWGDPFAVVGAGEVRRDGPDGSIVSDTPLQQGSKYAVDSIVADPSPARARGGLSGHLRPSGPAAA